MRVRHTLGVVGVAVAGGLVLGGCTGVVTPSKSGSGSASASASATSTASVSPTPEFGSDATIPADGVGEARANDVDEWTLVNRVDNAYARVTTPTDAEPLAVAAQAQINAWLTEYREAAGTGDSTQSPSPTSATSTAASANPSATGSASSPSESGEPTATAAPTTPQAAEPDSFRVLPQLLAARADVSGLRLYGRSSTSAGVVEHWRTVWFDPAAAEVVDGTALFATPQAGQPDPLGKARQLAGAAATGGVSDRDLFSAVAFTPDGDLIIRPVGAAEPLTLKKADVTPLLSPFGKQAQLAAADSVVRAGNGSTAAPSDSASATGSGSSPTATGDDEQSPTPSAASPTSS